MALTTLNKNFKNRGKDIKYLNKDFVQFRQNLIEFAKTYFPKTYSDFNETSPGMMFIEMSSYIGDSLSYYVDDTLKESLMVYAEDTANILALSQYLGYKPKVTSPAITTLSVYQLVPSRLDTSIGSGVRVPDERFFLRIKSGMRVNSTDGGISFYTTDVVDFSEDVDRTITEYSRNANDGTTEFYLVKKLVNAISGEQRELSFDFTTYQAFQTINLTETNVISIQDVRDSNGNKWYEVPYLAQEMVFVENPNIEVNDPDLFQFKSSVPYLLKTIKTPRRFTTKINQDSTTTIQFGAGDPSANDELLIPNFKNVGLGLPNSIDRIGESFDPTNFLKTKTYGTSPTNTTITVKYLVGGGIESNIAKGQLVRINSIQFDEDLGSIPTDLLGVYNTVKASIAVDNEIPATGGRGGETVEEIRENALANFGSQNRAVTAKDYQVRVLSMPSRFGSIAKAYATSDGSLDNNSPGSILASSDNLNEFTDLVMSFVEKPDDEEPNRKSVQEEIKKYLLGKTSNNGEVNNPFAINLYLLTYDGSGKLSQTLNSALKQNLKTFLNEFRLLTDGINILSGFIINIGINFEITVYENYNKSEVVTKCIQELKDYFQIDNWTFNQTINLSEVELLIANVEGVSSVPMFEVVNKCGGQYSANSYNIQAATKGKVIYPSLDPSVFEIKYPDTDIRGRAR
jgi:hypothetical protein